MSLNITKIDKALAECNRFIEAAIKAKQKIAGFKIEAPLGRLRNFESPTKENGTMKRASLDLTRALAELRK